MKGFALVLLCALVAVQARHTAVQRSAEAANLGENPWVVHLRFAVNYEGFLRTCAGSLISERWLLTTASCIQGSTFVWSRFGTVNAVNPSLVTETSMTSAALRIAHPEYDPATGANNIAVVNVNRVVHSTENIFPVVLASADAEIPASGKYCGYGANENGAAGEILKCAELDLEAQEDGSIRADAEASSFDSGAALVSNGVQVGILTAGDSTFTPVGQYVSWIEEVTGLNLSQEVAAEVAPQAVKVIDQAPVPVDAVRIVN